MPGWSTSNHPPGQDDGADTRQPAVQSVDELSWSEELPSTATTLARASSPAGRVGRAAQHLTSVERTGELERETPLPWTEGGGQEHPRVDECSQASVVGPRSGTLAVRPRK